MNHCKHLHGLSHAQLLSPQTRQHTQGCVECSALLQAIAEARATPPRTLPAERALAIQRALRASMQQPNAPHKARPSLRPLWGVAALFLLGLSAWWFVPAPGTPSVWVHVEPRPGALFSQESTATEEIILLQRGSIELQIDAQKPSQRVRLRSQQGEELVIVQAHLFVTAGYSFEEVTVQRGAVELISAQGEKRILNPGTTRMTPTATPESEPLPSTARTKPIVSAGVTPNNKKSPKPNEPPKVSPPSPETASYEEAFQRGVAALRDEKYSEAAAHFTEAEGSPVLAQESAYFRAVALHKAKKVDEEKAAIMNFLRKYPTASRASELHNSLAWLLMQEDDLEGAEAHFQEALKSNARIVQESAQRGIEQIKTKRGGTD